MSNASSLRPRLAGALSAAAALAVVALAPAAHAALVSPVSLIVAPAVVVVPVVPKPLDVSSGLTPPTGSPSVPTGTPPTLHRPTIGVVIAQPAPPPTM